MRTLCIGNSASLSRDIPSARWNATIPTSTGARQEARSRMYIPKAFEVTDRAALHDFIEGNSFATIVTSVEGAPFATRLPFILDRGAGASGTLIGHVARANPHWRSFDGRAQALAMFDGPHAYISPSWYVTSPAVPTWNYAT